MKMRLRQKQGFKVEDRRMKYEAYPISTTQNFAFSSLIILQSKHLHIFEFRVKLKWRKKSGRRSGGRSEANSLDCKYNLFCSCRKRPKREEKTKLPSHIKLKIIELSQIQNKKKLKKMNRREKKRRMIELRIELRTFSAPTVRR